MLINHGIRFVYGEHLKSKSNICESERYGYFGAEIDRKVSNKEYNAVEESNIAIRDLGRVWRKEIE